MLPLAFVLNARVCCVTGWRLIKDSEEAGFDEAALEKIGGGGGGSDMVTSFKEHLAQHLNEVVLNNRMKITQQATAEKARAEERRRELDLAERKVKLEEERAARDEARAQRDEERERLLMQLLARNAM